MTNDRGECVNQEEDDGLWLALLLGTLLGCLLRYVSDDHVNKLVQWILSR